MTGMIEVEECTGPICKWSPAIISTKDDLLIAPLETNFSELGELSNALIKITASICWTIRQLAFHHALDI